MWSTIVSKSFYNQNHRQEQCDFMQQHQLEGEDCYLGSSAGKNQSYYYNCTGTVLYYVMVKYLMFINKGTQEKPGRRIWHVIFTVISLYIGHFFKLFCHLNTCIPIHCSVAYIGVRRSVHKQCTEKSTSTLLSSTKCFV